MLERFKKGENSIISTRRGSEDLNNIATTSTHKGAEETFREDVDEGSPLILKGKSIDSA